MKRLALLVALLLAACGGGQLRELAKDTCEDLDGAIVLTAGVILANAIERAEELGYDPGELGREMRSECPEIMDAIAAVGEESQAEERRGAEMRARVDLVLDKCSSDGATGTVKNGWTERVDVTIEVQFLDDDQNLIDTGLDFVNGLRPGQTGQWEASFFGEGLARCESAISSVDES